MSEKKFEIIASVPSKHHPCLQNTAPKIAAKILTTRLQAHIMDLVSPLQTGFIWGRNIIDNSIFTTKLIQCCHK
jgi:hypothetical protein